MSFAKRDLDEHRKQRNRERQSDLADALAQMIRAIQEEHEAGREQDKPQQIQIPSLRLFTLVRQEENSQCDGQCADRQVDEKEPASGGVL
jgi:mannitol-1-phosphate/altronate dehydrogenase